MAYAHEAKGSRYGKKGDSRGPGWHNTGKQRKHQEQLAAEAKVRQEIAAKQSPKQRLAVLDQRLGKNVGAVRERTRLQALIAK